MSQHDRGAFGELLARLKKHTDAVLFQCDFTVSDEDPERWQLYCADIKTGGRTGEEALRRAVEELEKRT